MCWRIGAGRASLMVRHMFSAVGGGENPVEHATVKEVSERVTKAMAGVVATGAV